MIKTNKGNRLVLDCTCLFRYQVCTNTKEINFHLDLPDLAETAKSFIVKNSNVRCGIRTHEPLRISS